MTETDNTQQPGPSSAPPPPPAAPQYPPIDLQSVFTQSLELYKTHPVPFFVGNLIMGLINGVAFGLLMGPYFKGIQTMVRKAQNGETPAIGDVFSGFDNFGSAFVGGLLFCLCVGFGTMFCYVPGLFAAAFLTHIVGLSIMGYPIGECFNMSIERCKANLGSHILYWVAMPLALFIAVLPGYIFMLFINFFLGLLLVYGLMFVVSPLLMISWNMVFDSQFRQ